MVALPRGIEEDDDTRLMRFAALDGAEPGVLVPPLARDFLARNGETGAGGEARECVEEVVGGKTMDETLAVGEREPARV